MKTLVLRKLAPATIAVAVTLFTALATTTNLVQPGLGSMLMFWFLGVPLIAIGIATLISSHQLTARTASIGTLIFYGLVVFLTYSHWHSDFYVILKTSFIWNVMIFTALSILVWNVISSKR